MNFCCHDFPRIYTPPIRGLIKQKPEDFQVDEIPLIEPEGDGEHVWLHVRKTGANTDWVAGQLAKIAGVARKHVSYAGMKDRHAITTQWFSIHMPGQPTPNFDITLPEGVEILNITRHSRKLKRGALKGNRFTIVARECEGEVDDLEEIVKSIGTKGVPNYFGHQRFGRDNQNITSVQKWFKTGKKPKQKNLQGLYLSAARSWIFNEVVAERIRQGNWDVPINGDVFMLNGSQSCFYQAIDSSLQDRFQSGDLHLTAPMWGKGELLSQGVVNDLELSVAERYSDLSHGLVKRGLRQERRAIRLLPYNFSLNVCKNKTVRWQFELDAGTFATSVLREMIEY